MKKLIILTATILLTTLSFGQSIQNQVVGSAGNRDTIGEYLVSWTVGELMVEKFTNPDCVVTQGFHQTFFTISGVDLPSEAQFRVICYPNPTVKDIHIKIESDKPNEHFSIALTNISGRQLLQKEILAGEVETIDLSGFNASLLLLTIIQSSEKKAQTFKIIKQNHY